jgi:hypothetical protein
MSEIGEPETGGSETAEADVAAVAGIPDLLALVIARLESAGVKQETLGVMREPRKIAIFTSAALMQPAGSVWRLGVVLLDATGRLYSTGSVTRAVEPLRGVTNQSIEAEERRDIRRAAARGSFDEGEVINFNFAPIATDAESVLAASGTLSVAEGTVMVRLGTDAIVPLERYLSDRVTLLIGD